MPIRDLAIRYRPVLLSVGAVAFAVWQATEVQIIDRAFPAGALDTLGAAAVVVWLAVIGCLLGSAIGRKRAVGDEFTQHNQYVALSWGYWLMIAGGFVALSTAARTAIPAVDIIRLMLIAGIAAPMLLFAFMEREPAGE